MVEEPAYQFRLLPGFLERCIINDEEFFPIIERMSEAPCLELFSRRQPTTYCRDNWSVWGNEIESDIYIPGYPVPKYSSKATLPKEMEEDV